MTLKPAFKHGDIVRRKDNYSKIGMVLIWDFNQPPIEYARVQWREASQAKLVRVDDIELNPNEADNERTRETAQ